MCIRDRARSINLGEIMKPEYQAAVMKKYGFMDWDSVLAAIGHGALKDCLLYTSAE